MNLKVRKGWAVAVGLTCGLGLGIGNVPLPDARAQPTPNQPDSANDPAAEVKRLEAKLELAKKQLEQTEKTLQVQFRTEQKRRERLVQLAAELAKQASSNGEKGNELDNGKGKQKGRPNQDGITAAIEPQRDLVLVQAGLRRIKTRQLVLLVETEVKIQQLTNEVASLEKKSAALTAWRERLKGKDQGQPDQEAVKAIREFEVTVAQVQADLEQVEARRLLTYVELAGADTKVQQLASEVDSLERKIAASTARRGRTKGTVKDKGQPDKDALRAEIELQRDIVVAQAEFVRAEAQFSTMRAELTALKTRVRQLMSQVDLFEHRPATQLWFNLRVFEGDPLGSQEAGTLRFVAESHLVATESRPFTFASGGQHAVVSGDGVEFVRIGRTIEATPGAVKDGQLRLDITLSNAAVGERSEERIQLHIESTRTVTTVRLGEVMKLRWARGTAKKQAWVELSVAEYRPMAQFSDRDFLKLYFRQEAADLPARDADIPGLIRAATTPPAPGENYPALPSLSTEMRRHVANEITDSKAVRAAYAKLDVQAQNVTWFEGVGELEKAKAVWCLQSCLCHPSSDVQIRALQSLRRLGNVKAVPFLVIYAEYMAVLVEGSEGATIHGVLQSELAKTLSTLTKVEVTVHKHQDPEGLKKGIRRWQKWLSEQPE